MNVFGQLRQFCESAQQIVAEANRVWRSETKALQSLDRMNRFEQLDKRTFAGDGRKFVPAIEIHDLPQKSDLFHAARDEAAHFPDDLLR